MKRELKLLQRKDGSFSVYYERFGTHMVVYDSLDNNTLSAEIARVKDAYQRLANHVLAFIAYRHSAGALNFQLEKADDYFNDLKKVLEQSEL